ERVITGALGFQRIADGLRRAAEFGQRMKMPVWRIEAMNLECHARRGGRIEMRLQPFDIGVLFDRMNEALIPDFFRGWCLGHHLPQRLTCGTVDRPRGMAMSLVLRPLHM